MKLTYPLRPHEALNRHFVTGEVVDVDFDSDEDLAELARVLGLELEEKPE